MTKAIKYCTICATHLTGPQSLWSGSLTVPADRMNSEARDCLLIGCCWSAMVIAFFFVISLKLVFLTELGVVDGAFVVVRNVVWLPPTCTDRVVLPTYMCCGRARRRHRRHSKNERRKSFCCIIALFLLPVGVYSVQFNLLHLQ